MPSQGNESAVVGQPLLDGLCYDFNDYSAAACDCGPYGSVHPGIEIDRYRDRSMLR